MATSPLNVVMRRLLADQGPDGHGMTDGELLARFLSGRDDGALAALVRRHAPMVWGVCCRLLHNHDDAADAFQATFLVLVRKAASVPRQAIANWLYGVARQTAVRLRATAAKRGRRETQVVNMPEPTVAQVRDADLQAVLDEELGRLPGHYRGVIVLCDLEDMTRKEAARELAIPEGSVASRLARARAMLAKRLTRRGVVFTGGPIAAALAAAPAPASATAPPALVVSTIQAATLLAAGKAAGVVSAEVAALAQGVVRAMFLAKLKTVTCALALTVLVGFGGVTLRGAGFQPADGATGTQPAEDIKPGADARKLVRQLSGTDFAKRQAAEKALADLGARAAAAVQAGTQDADTEIATRCTALWPRLWQAEIARPDAERLAGYDHPLWARFRNAAGDDPDSRTLFAEMAADVTRFSRLEAVEADPEKAVAAYAAELKQRDEALERGYREAPEAESRNPPIGGFRPIVPASGLPTRSESVTLLFLGTYPATAKNENHVALYSATPPALRRLFAAWLAMRTAPGPIATGLINTLSHNVPEVLPLAVAHAANDKLAPRARGFALLVVGSYGTAADVPVLEKAFADSRVYHTTEAAKRPVEVQVSDAAVAAALWLAGKDPADIGFTLMEMYEMRGSAARQLATVNVYGLIGFFDNTARQAAHKKAREWLDEHRKAPWSAAVEGLQCWLEADKAVWKVDEVPTFRLHVRNQGKRDHEIHMAQAACKLEVDGAWFDWNAPVSIPAGTWPAGRQYEDFEVRVTLEPPWSRDNKPIAVKPGKHTVRVAYVTLDRKQPVRVVSNAVEIEVAAAKAASPATSMTTTGDQALDGLWEDIENKGAWLRFNGGSLKHHPAGKSDEVEWTCRYNLTLTPMTIDIFKKDGTAHGIFVFERGTLFIALARTGEERPTRFKRDEATTLFVLRRPVKRE